MSDHLIYPKVEDGYEVDEETILVRITGKLYVLNKSHPFDFKFQFLQAIEAIISKVDTSTPYDCMCNDCIQNFSSQHIHFHSIFVCTINLTDTDTFFFTCTHTFTHKPCICINRCSHIEKCRYE